MTREQLDNAIKSHDEKYPFVGNNLNLSETQLKEEELNPEWKWEPGDALVRQNQKSGFSLLVDIIEYPDRQGYLLCYGNRTRMKIDINAMRTMIVRYDNDRKNGKK